MIATTTPLSPESGPDGLGEVPAGVDERRTISMTIAICTRDRPESLLRCVKSIVSQTTLPIELIIVDDGRLPETVRATIVRSSMAAGVRLVILRKSAPGLPGSRNLAVRHARGEIVQFLDDDVELDPDFCGRIARIYERDPAGVVVGAEGVLVDEVPSVAARLFGLVYRLAGWWALRPRDACRSPLPPGLRDSRWAVPVAYLSGACMSFRRSVLQRYAFDEGLGGYALGEDRECSLQISREGRLLHVRGAMAVHRHDPAGRPDYFAFGRMTVHNYIRAMCRISRTSLGDKLVLAYTFSIIGSALAICSLIKPRRYLPEFKGVLTALGEVMMGAITDLAKPDGDTGTLAR